MAWRGTYVLTAAALALLISATLTSALSSSKCSCKPHRLRCGPKKVIAVTDARHVYRVTSQQSATCLKRSQQPRTCPRKNDACCKWNGKMDASGSMSHHEAGQLHSRCWGQGVCRFRVDTSLAEPGPSSHMAVPLISSLEYQCVQDSATTTFASATAVTSEQVMSSFEASRIGDYFSARDPPGAENKWLCNVTSRKAVKAIVALANPHKPRTMAASSSCDVTLTAGSSYLPCGDVYMSFPLTTPFNVTLHLARKHIPNAAYVVISADANVTLRCGEKVHRDVTTTTTEATTTPTSTTTTSTTTTTTTTTTTPTPTTAAATTTKAVTSPKTVTEENSGDDVSVLSPSASQGNTGVSETPEVVNTTAEVDHTTKDVTPQIKSSLSDSGSSSLAAFVLPLQATMLSLLFQCVL